jgi:hypothetical protein
VSGTVPQAIWAPSHETGGIGSGHAPGSIERATAEERSALRESDSRETYLARVTANDRVETSPDVKPKPESEPGSTSARIVVHYEGAKESAEDVAELLNSVGFGQSELRRVPFRIATTNVRYFHRQNRRVAVDVTDVLRAMGSRSELRDFTDYSPLPSVGTIEVWIADQPG